MIIDRQGAIAVESYFEWVDFKNHCIVYIYKIDL